MAAALLARALGAEPAALRRALAGFRGLPHRMERVAEAAGVTWYDDSKATNFAAVAKSLVDLPAGRVHLILGGLGKGDDPAEVVALARDKAKRLYLIGDAAEGFARAFDGVAPIERSGTLERAVAAAARAAERRRRGAPVAGLRQLRPVRRLRPPRRGLPAPGARVGRCRRGRGGGTGGRG